MRRHRGPVGSGRPDRAASRSARSTAFTPDTSTSSSTAVRAARERGLTAAVVTFDHHPLAIVDPAHQPRLLTPLAVKRELIAALGADELVVLPFRRGPGRPRSPPTSAASVLSRRASTPGGRRRSELHLRRPRRRHGGDAGGLRPAARVRDRSSSRCCSHTASRSARRASAVCSTRGGCPRCAPYSGARRASWASWSTVTSADARLGFPTANIDAHTGMIFPGRGVYAARVQAPRSLVSRRRQCRPQPDVPAPRRRGGLRAHRGLPARLLGATPTARS